MSGRVEHQCSTLLVFDPGFCESLILGLIGAVTVAGVAAIAATYLPARWVTKGVIAEGLWYE